MKRVTPFRVAAALLVLFCAGHTAGGMLAQKSLGPTADAVFAQMKGVHFGFNGADCTWYGFWFGFGLTVSLFLLSSAVIVWQLDKLPVAAWGPASVMAWCLIAAHGVNTFLSWKYFFLGPALFGVAITGLMIWGTLRKTAAASAR